MIQFIIKTKVGKEMAKVLVVRVHQFDRSVSSSMKVLDAF